MSIHSIKTNKNRQYELEQFNKIEITFKKMLAIIDIAIYNCITRRRREERGMLKKLREQRHLTQSEVAHAVGVTRSTITMIEIGINKPSVKLAQALGKYFGVSWTIFFDDDAI